MRQRAILALALAGALLGCAPEREGGGGGLGPSMQPTTVTMVPRMISGQGMVTYRPVGDEVEVHVRAENLPEPYTYQFRLIGPGRGAAPTARRSSWSGPGSLRDASTRRSA